MTTTGASRFAVERVMSSATVTTRRTSASSAVTRPSRVGGRVVDLRVVVGEERLGRGGDEPWTVVVERREVEEAGGDRTHLVGGGREADQPLGDADRADGRRGVLGLLRHRVLTSSRRPGGPRRRARGTPWRCRWSPRPPPRKRARASSMAWALDARSSRLASAAWVSCVGLLGQGVPVLGEHLVPRGRHDLGDLAQARVGRQLEELGQRGEVDGPGQLGGADRRDDVVDLAGRAGQPPRAGGLDEGALHLDAVGERLEQLAGPPQRLGQVRAGCDDLGLAFVHAVLIGSGASDLSDVPASLPRGAGPRRAARTPHGPAVRTTPSDRSANRTSTEGAEVRAGASPGGGVRWAVRRFAS